MNETKIVANARILEREFSWLEKVIAIRFNLYFRQSLDEQDIFSIPPRDIEEDASPYAQFIKMMNQELAAEWIGETDKEGGEDEEGGEDKKGEEGEKGEVDEELQRWQYENRLVILLALAPHLKPELLDIFFTKNSLYDRGYTEFGGIIGQEHSGFLPTGETVMFLLAGDNLNRRLSLRTSLFAEDHFFFRQQVLRLSGKTMQEPFLSGVLSITEEYLTLFTSGDAFQPVYSTRFPAKRLRSKLSWDDLVLEPYVLDEIEEIYAWLKHEETILREWGMDRIITAGYRALFYGPPGTGKTLSAALLGKRSNRPVYRIDLSQLVSKYIGETEKNLAAIFDLAESRKWILFFDEADALFGKRSASRDAKDRYANQEIAYLLQRIEDFDGLIILATNLKGNIDEAFSRRFQSMVYFPMPNPELRHKLWQSSLPSAIQLADDVKLPQIAADHELAGGAIVNVIRYCAIAALRHGEPFQFTRGDLEYGIRRELRKEGKTV